MIYEDQLLACSKRFVTRRKSGGETGCTLEMSSFCSGAPLAMTPSEATSKSDCVCPTTA